MGRGSFLLARQYLIEHGKKLTPKEQQRILGEAFVQGYITNTLGMLSDIGGKPQFMPLATWKEKFAYYVGAAPSPENLLALRNGYKDRLYWELDALDEHRDLDMKTARELPSAFRRDGLSDSTYGRIVFCLEQLALIEDELKLPRVDRFHPKMLKQLESELERRRTWIE